MKTPRQTAVRVSNHALLRFLERAGGLDVDGLRTAIEASLNRSLTAAETLGTGNVIVNADGLQYVIRNGIVVTILDNVARSRVVDTP